MRCLTSMFVFLALTGWVRAQDTTVLRYLQMRDGSTLRLPVLDESWTIFTTSADGTTQTRSLRPSQIQRLQLSGSEDFAHRKQLLTAVAQLGAADFRQRERAWLLLRHLGPASRADLEACLRQSTDSETQNRLQELLHCLPAPADTAPDQEAAFDRVVAAQTFWGSLGEQPIRVQFGGKIYPLTRRHVEQMTAGPPPLEAVSAGQKRGGFQRRQSEQFPDTGCTTETFEQDAHGRWRQYGENVEEAFIDRGFVLSSPGASTPVSIQNDNMLRQNGSRAIGLGQAAQTMAIEIRFIQPGQEHLPGAVSHFGCWIGSAARGSVSLLAYDLQGRELGKIVSEKNHLEFLGVASEIPMHTIRVVSTAERSRPLRLDDFIFRRAANPQAAHPTHFLVSLAAGGRILCQDVRLSEGQCQLVGLPAGLPDWHLPLEQVSRVTVPHRLQADGALPSSGLYAELKDGSIIYARQPDDFFHRPTFSRRPDLFKHAGDLAALWSAHVPRRTFTDSGAIPAVWSPGEQRWQAISSLRLLEEVVLWQNADGKFSASGYARLRSLRLAPAAKAAPGVWRVRTIHGEDLVLPSTEALTGRLSSALSATWQGQPLRIPAAEIVALYQSGSKD